MLCVRIAGPVAHCLFHDPDIDVRVREAPTAPDLESGDLLGGNQPVDRSLGGFQVVSEFPDRHDSAQALN